MRSKQTISTTMQMTALDNASLPKRHGRNAIGSSGFTLVEMLVVIGIIVLLIGIALPMLNRAYKNAVRTRMAGDLQAISAGLEAYRGDFKDYPRIDYSVAAAGTGSVTITSTVSGSVPGAVVLCWALLAPGADAQDGADGPGFRARSFQPSGGGTSTGQGQLYGPYIAPGRFKIGSGTDDTVSTINDRYGHPYLYFPANRGNCRRRPTCSRGITTRRPSPMFDANDNLAAFAHTGDSDPKYPLYRIQSMVGDIGNGTTPGTNPNGMIDGTETANFVGNYILWGAGPDEVYGPNFISTATAPPFDLSNCDDVIVSQ